MNGLHSALIPYPHDMMAKRQAKQKKKQSRKDVVFSSHLVNLRLIRRMHILNQQTHAVMNEGDGEKCTTTFN